MRNITFPVTGTPALLVLSGGGTSGMAQPTGVPFFFVAPLSTSPDFPDQTSGRPHRNNQFPISSF
jgi:hypothetical protein